MPRNGSGTYSLPAGNPVVSGTTIESSWANTTLSDIGTAMTDSLSRSGQGGMTAAFRAADGTSSVPGIAWSNETGSGFYRAGSNDVRFVIGTAEAYKVTSTAVTFSLNTVIDGGTFVFNESGADKDARFEGDTDVNLLFTDASTDRVGIGTATPTSKLDVYGAINPRITVSSGAGTAPGFSISQSGQTEVAIFQPASSSDLSFYIGSERFRIGSAGQLGIAGANYGTSGQVLTSQGSGSAPIWSNAGSLSGQTDSASPFETSLGALAGQSSTGVRNTFVGYASGASNTSGQDVCAIGTQALNANTTGSENTAVGSNALSSNLTGVRNCAVGYQSLATNSASNNTAVGAYSLNANTTGTGNTATGYLALAYCETGNSNSAFGNLCLLYSTSNNNSAFGNFALASLTTGNSNTAIGQYAGYDVISGSNNTCLGSLAQPSSGSVSNEITLGNSSVSTLRCATTTITSLSDARDKKNIVDLPAGLAFINAVRPVAFDWNARDESKVDIPDTGFLAQNLQQVQAQLGVTIPGLVYDNNPEKLEAGYSKLLPVLVKAIQELSAEVEALKAQIA